MTPMGRVARAIKNLQRSTFDVTGKACRLVMNSVQKITRLCVVHTCFDRYDPLSTSRNHLFDRMDEIAVIPGRVIPAIAKSVASN